MREILFRAKATNREKGRFYRTKYKNGDWVFGLLTDLKNYAGFAEMTNTNGVSGIEVDPETVGQFTGLTDKNGKKIFEGDVVQYFGTYPLEVFIENGHAKFRFYDTYSKRQYEELFFGHDEEYGKCEVIGNIHDNPELIGGNEHG